MNFTRSFSGSKSSEKEFQADKSPSPSERSIKGMNEKPSVHLKLPASFCGIQIFESKDSSDEISLKCLSNQDHPKRNDSIDEKCRVNGTVENVYVKTDKIKNGQSMTLTEKVNGSNKENLDIESAGYNGISTRI